MKKAKYVKYRVKIIVKGEVRNWYSSEDFGVALYEAQRIMRLPIVEYSYVVPVEYK